jgi:hypothetical protein
VLWMTRVILRPKVACNADAATLEQIHHLGARSLLHRQLG